MGAAASGDIRDGTTIVAPASGDNGAIRRNQRFADRLRLTAFEEEGVYTCYDMFQRGLRISGDRNCLGYRPVLEEKEVTSADGKKSIETAVGDFTWFSYNQVWEKIRHVASGIQHFNLAVENDLGHKLVGIYAKNRWEWYVTQQALWASKSASVPMYDTLGAEALQFIVRQTGLSTVFCSKLETPKLLALKTAHAEDAAALKNIVQFEDVSEATRKAAAEAGITIYSFQQIAEAGGFNLKEPIKPAPEDIAVICYTSGTTGNPKGAIMTHKVMVADASGAKYADLGITADDVHLSYLPLAHIFEQLVDNAVVVEGAAMGYYQGDTLKILEDIKALRPTLFPSVPRLFNRIYDRIHSNVATKGGLSQTMFNNAFEGKRYWLRQNHFRHSVWDSLVFSKVATAVGLDRCRLLVSGSAPLAAHVMEFLRIVFACRMVEGYGQTECGGAATVTSVYDQASIGHVGIPLACNEVKLVSVPDLGYLVTDKVHGEERDKAGNIVHPGIRCDGRGEVCYRGPNIFPGYYKDPEKTAEAIDAEGWLHSGDIGLWTAEGNLKIIDRKKNMFKLSQGEYVAAEKVENALLSSWVQQIFVYGDSLHAVLVAIVVPNPDTLRNWARENGRPDASASELVADKGLRDLILRDMQTRGRAAGLQGFEIPKAVHLDSNPWTAENILTPTFKLKRADAKRYYQEQIDAMYEVVDPVAGLKGLKQGAA